MYRTSGPTISLNMAVSRFEAIEFFRAFFHLLAGMFLAIAIFVPIISLLNGLESHAASNGSFWSVLYFLLMPGTGIGLLATAFGTSRWKVYVRRTSYTLLAFFVLVAIGSH
jgi:hypothetical protein